MNFNVLSLLFSAHGFGFNTNLFETNVINLSAVIAIVVSFVGDAVKELLKTRKETILNNLQEADNRALEAQEKLLQAKAQLSLAQKKATEIHEQGIAAAEQERKRCLKQAEEDAERQEKLKQDTIRLQQQKAIQQISQQIVSLALQQVRQKLKTGANSNFHILVNNLKIALLKNTIIGTV